MSSFEASIKQAFNKATLLDILFSISSLFLFKRIDSEFELYAWLSLMILGFHALSIYSEKTGPNNDNLYEKKQHDEDYHYVDISL
jgi:hypothetical protein